MALKRMFSMEIVNDDRFVEMSHTAQALYFHLGMRADDEGFVGSCNQLIRGLGFNKGDIKTLYQEGFIILFETGVIVITDWNVNNNIRQDRAKLTRYQEERRKLAMDSGKYLLCPEGYTPLPDNSQTDDSQMSDNCQADDGQVSGNCQADDGQLPAQYRLGEYRLDLDQSIIGEEEKNSAPLPYEKIVNLYHKTCTSLPKIRAMTEKRKKAVDALIHEGYTFEDIVRLFGIAQESKFLTGSNTRNWTATFDWLTDCENIPKVLEGNYSDHTVEQNTTFDIDFLVQYWNDHVPEL